MNDYDPLVIANCYNFLRLNSKIAYICKTNFLAEKLSYCLENNLISEKLITELYWKDKIVKECDNLEMNNPYEQLTV